LTKGDEELLLFQMLYVKIKRHSLCKNINSYDLDSVKYFFLRNKNYSADVLISNNSKKYISKTPKRLLSCLWGQFF